MADSLVRLAQALTPSQATSIAASLEIDGRLDYAIGLLPGTAHPAAALLGDSLAFLGEATILASILRGYAAVAKNGPNPPRAVWSGPSFDGDSDHTTAAVAHLIDRAKDDIFASTFSATADSPFVIALWRALARGVSVTVLVEGNKMAGAAAALRKKLAGARFLSYVPPAGEYGVQHSKVVIVDSAVVLVTSANLSDAAAHRNLEAGVLISDPDFASKMRQRFAVLQAEKRIAADD